MPTLFPSFDPMLNITDFLLSLALLCIAIPLLYLLLRFCWNVSSQILKTVQNIIVSLFTKSWTHLYSSGERYPRYLGCSYPECKCLFCHCRKSPKCPNCYGLCGLCYKCKQRGNCFLGCRCRRCWCKFAVPKK